MWRLRCCSTESTTVKNKATLSFLHAHYLDCLLQSVRSRQSIAHRTATVDNVLKFMTRFNTLHRLGNHYTRYFDFSRTPLVAIRDGVLIKPSDVIDPKDLEALETDDFTATPVYHEL